MSPKKAPMLQKMIECHSTFTFMKIMQNPAVTIPVRVKTIISISVVRTTKVLTSFNEKKKTNEMKELVFNGSYPTQLTNSN
jgi:hypothetical protein